MEIETVAMAYDELTALNLTPSVRKIRERVGGGSFSTIGALLKQVQADRIAEDAAAAALPELVKQQCDRFLLQLWGSLRAEAETNAAAIQKTADIKVAEAAREHESLLVEADQVMLEIDALKVRIEELQNELMLEKALKTDRERELAIAERRLKDQVIRTAGLQRSLDLTLAGPAKPREDFPIIPDATPEQMANVLDVVTRNLAEGLDINETDLYELPGLINESSSVVSLSIDALVGKGLLGRSAEGGLSIPALPAAAAKSPFAKTSSPPTAVNAASGGARRKV